jgi:glycosyltransferase involved in cell wall biosynthesis
MKEYPVVRSLGCPNARSGRALLDFVVDPFLPEFRAELGRSHANYWIATAIVECLSEIGFAVDVTDWRNMHAPPSSDYDLVVGLGRAFTKSCAGPRGRARRIYLGWGLHSTDTINAVAERVRLLRERRGVALSQTHPADDGPRFADAVFYLGNEHVRASYAAVTRAPLLQLPNPVVDGIVCTLQQKDFAAARRHFMWMAAYGTLRRALDVLLEVFATEPDCHLWICGDISHERGFCEAYARELKGLTNIHNVGWVDVAGAPFAAVTSRCGYMLYPSVSDGMPGSVVNAMAAGVIPIVTYSAGMETGGLGRIIPSIDDAAIRRAVRESALAEPEDLEKEAQRVANFARTYYSQAAFRQQLSSAFEAVLGDSRRE